MKLTSRNEHHSDFIESLYNNLRKETEFVLNKKNQYVHKAASYVDDGLSDGEAVELMIIETGLPREACEGYVCMASQNSVESLDEFSFQFEDSDGKVWSSIDIGKNIYAENEDNAWELAEEMLDNELLSVGAERIISINKIG